MIEFRFNIWTYFIGIVISIAIHAVVAMGMYILLKEQIVDYNFVSFLVLASSVAATSIAVALMFVRNNLEKMCSGVLQENFQLQAHLQVQELNQKEINLEE